MRLLTDRRGNFAIISALVFYSSGVALGAALDFSQAYRLQRERQGDADAAAPAAASQLLKTDAQLVIIPTNFVLTSSSTKNGLTPVTLK